MYQSIQLKNTTPTSGNSISRSSSRPAFVLVALILASLPLSPQARAVCEQGCSVIENTFLGEGALILNSSGNRNTAIGFQALTSNDDGFENTAVGRDALAINTSGFENTATGADALLGNTTGNNNTANGFFALFSNSTGSSNTADGSFALKDNTGGIENTAIGFEALSKSLASFNTAIGARALSTNTTGFSNTAAGSEALQNNTDGRNNTAIGAAALINNTIGTGNTAIGDGVMLGNDTGFFNTAIGNSALFENSTGRRNIALGDEAGRHITGSDNIDIGNMGVAGESGVMRFGTEGTQSATFIAGIVNSPLVTGTAVGVGITSTGQLGVRASSARFKEAIKPMNEMSEAILSLHPVSFRYKKELDPKGTPQFGLVAEEVAKVDPDLVVTDEKGKPFTVRYEEVNAMLLNEFLKDHRGVQDLRNTVAKQEARIAQQQQEIQALTAGLQKVSNQLEMTKPAARVVTNN